MGRVGAKGYGAGIVFGCVLLCSVAAMAQATSAPGMATLEEPQVFVFDKVSPHKAANGSDSRNLVRGLLKSGEAVAVHESLQPAGVAPVPQHVIQHSELIVVCEGTVAFEHGDRSETVGPGDVIYVPTGTMHRLRNTGAGTARYVVLAIGGDTKK